MVEHILSLPAHDLAYRAWLHGQEPLLLLHGLADHSGVWSQLAAHLQQHSPRYHIVAPDLRGHGNSSKPATGYQCSDFIADLEALMAHLDWSSAHVLAHSWSAKVVTVWASQSPQRFRSLMLIDPFFINRIPLWLTPTLPLLYRVLPFLQMLGPFPSYDRAEAQARKLKQYRGWSEFQQQVFRESIEQKSDGTWGSKFVIQARNEIFIDVMRVAGLTVPLTIPTLLVQPQQGLNRFDWQLQPYRTHLRHLQIAPVSGNHWCFLVEPAAFHPIVSQFLVSR